MKVVQYFASFVIVAVVLSVGAFAKDSHSGNFTLADTVQVGSTQLAHPATTRPNGMVQPMT